jgi:hypothetical protein
MKFLMTYHANPDLPPASPEKMAAIGKYSAEMIEKGIVLMTGGLIRPTKGTQVRLAGGKFSVTDGPFAETKELIDGFALIQAASKDEATEHARNFMRLAGDGDGEILQVFEYGEGQPG